MTDRSLSINGEKVTQAFVQYTDDPFVAAEVANFIEKAESAFDVRLIARPTFDSRWYVSVSTIDSHVLPSKTSGKNELKDDGFALSITPGRVVVVSREPMGLAYGLSALLERLDFRFYMPGDLGTVLPRGSTDLALGVSVENPSFPYRSIGSNATTRADPWFMRACRGNVNIGYEADGNYGKLVWGVLHTASQLALPQPPADRALLVAATAQRLYDISNEGDYDLLTLGPEDGADFSSWFIQTPSGFNRPDQSGRWLANSGDIPGDEAMTGPIVEFYEDVYAQYRTLGGLMPVRMGLYFIYTAPPVDNARSMPEGFIPHIANYQYDNVHAVTAGTPLNERYRSIIEQWGVRSEWIFVYEYFFKANWIGLPWPIHQHLPDKMQYYRAHKVNGVHTQSNPRNAFSNILNYYMAGRLMWNADAPYAAIRDEFFERFYGAAASSMNEAFTIFEDGFARSDQSISGDAPNYSEVFTRQQIQDALAHAERGALAVTDSLLQNRVEMTLLWLRYSLAVHDLFSGTSLDTAKQSIRTTFAQMTEKGYPILKIEEAQWYLESYYKVMAF